MFTACTFTFLLFVSCVDLRLQVVYILLKPRGKNKFQKNPKSILKDTGNNHTSIKTGMIWALSLFKCIFFFFWSMHNLWQVW